MDKTRRVCLAVGLFLASSVFFPILLQAGVGVTPASLSFGSVTVNTTSPAASIVVTNGSRQSVSILKVSSTLPEFIVVSPAMPITLGPHGSTSFQVQFRPDAAISFSGSLVLNTSRRNGGTQSIAISGMGTAASSSSSQSYLLSTECNQHELRQCSHWGFHFPSDCADEYRDGQRQHFAGCHRGFWIRRQWFLRGRNASCRTEFYRDCQFCADHRRECGREPQRRQQRDQFALYNFAEWQWSTAADRRDTCQHWLW